MIRLADIEVRKETNDSYLVIGANQSCIHTTREGILAMLAFDCTASKNEATTKAEHIVGAGWDLHAFFDVLAEQGFIFRADRIWQPLFQPCRFISAMSLPDFRSLSEVNISPSSECDLRCQYCVSNTRPGMLPPDCLSHVIHEAGDLGANTMNILGGEPTLFSETTVQCIHFAREAGFSRIAVSTNGHKMTTGMAREWAQGGATTLQLSIDDLALGPKSLATVPVEISYLRDVFEEVVIAYVFHGQHPLDTVVEFVSRLLQYDVSIDLKTVIPYEDQELPCSLIDIGRFDTLANELASRNPHVNAQPRGVEGVWCGAGGSSVVIQANGAVKPCVFVHEVMGNVLTEAFSDIWLDWKRWEKFRKFQQLPRECMRCVHVRYCINGCTARYRSRIKCCTMRQRYVRGSKRGNEIRKKGEA